MLFSYLVIFLSIDDDRLKDVSDAGLYLG